MVGGRDVEIVRRGGRWKACLDDSVLVLRRQALAAAVDVHDPVTILQIDIEASFVRPDDIFALTEGMLAAIFKAARKIDIRLPFDRLTYHEAVGRYGSDKPDRRFGMELVDFSEEFRSSGFKVFRGALDAGGVVKAINAKGFAGITIGQVDELTGIAKTFGAKGLAFIKVENNEWKSPIVKFFTDAEKAALKSKLNIEEGDCLFFAADQWDVACEVLGRLRLRIAEIQKLTAGSDKRQSGSDFTGSASFHLNNSTTQPLSDAAMQ